MFWATLWTGLTNQQTMMHFIKSLGGLTRGRGMDESTQNIWISTLHHCTAIERSMRKITKTVYQTSEHHVELGKSRSTKDNQNLQKLYSRLQQFNLFDLCDYRPRGKRIRQNQLLSSRSHWTANNVGYGQENGNRDER